MDALTTELDLTAREELLRDILRRHAPLLIAYSGGVDSTLLLAIAHQTLGAKATGIIADSPSLPRASLVQALHVAGGGIFRDRTTPGSWTNQGRRKGSLPQAGAPHRRLTCPAVPEFENPTRHTSDSGDA